MDDYSVKLYARAYRDLDDIYTHIAKSLMEPSTAVRLIDELETAIFSLEQLPERGPIRRIGAYEMGVPNPIGVHLSYTGLKWRESYYKSILKYIADKWTDIIASIISLISLILSIIALNKR